MKKGMLLLALLLVVVGCKKSGSDVVATKSLETKRDSLSYSIGVDFGQNFKGFEEEINLDAFAQGVFDILNDKEIRISDSVAGPLIKAEMSRIVSARIENFKAEGLAHLEVNKLREGVVVTESGLQYQVVKKGEGAVPTDSSMVEVHYTGTMVDGKVFDSSRKRGKTVKFPVNGVIKGWTEVLKLMPVGSIYKVTIPSELAYGANPDPRSGIAPHSVLIFDIELVSIVEEEKK